MRLPKRSFISTLEAFERRYPTKATIPTVEMIGFQKNDSFGPAMEEIVTKYQDLVKQGLSHKAIQSDQELKRSFEDLIFARFGLKVELITNNMLAAVIPNYYLENNPITSDYFRGWFKGSTDLPGVQDIKKMVGKDLGTINMETAKVTGWFSKQSSPIFVNFKNLIDNYKVEAPEIVGIILHEIGHIFDAIAFLNRQHTGNRIIADVARYIEGNKEKPDVDYVYKEIKKVDPKATRDIAEGLVSGNAPVMGVTLYRLAIGQMQSSMSDDTYDRVQFEAMSDVFATRFGYGPMVVSGLEKFESVYSDYENSAIRALSMVQMTASWLLTLASVLTIPMGPFVFVIRVVVLAIVAWVIGTNTGSRGIFRLYDNTAQRYARIRNQIVEQIKNPELEPDLRRNLLQQIETIDAIIEGKKTFSFIFDRIMDSINPKDRNAKNSIESQQRIESMIANDLFVQSARLKD